jgi:hypothetical protein
MINEFRTQADIHGSEVVFELGYLYLYMRAVFELCAFVERVEELHYQFHVGRNVMKLVTGTRQ